MYLSFGSTILEDNQVTDYLIRVVQPRLSAIEGVQRADILGGRTFAMRAWLKPDRMAALNVSPAQVRAGAGRQQLPRRRRPDQGRARPGQPDGRRPTCSRSTSSSSSSSASRTARWCASRTSPTWCSAPTTTTRTCASAARRAVFMGVWVLPNANSLDVIERVRKEMDAIKSELPDRHARRASPSTRPTYIDRRDRRGRAHADRDGADRHRRHLPVPRLAAHGARAAGRHPGVADRRRLPDAGVRLHAEPAHAARDRALGRSGGRRRDRRRRERRAPHARGQDAARGGARSARASWSGRSSR